MGIVVLQVCSQACDEFRGRCEVATFQEATSQGAEPQFDLVEPGAMLGCEVKDMLVLGVGQESPSLCASAQVAFVERQSVQLRHEFANVQAPMRVQVVENPMEAFVLGELRGDMGQVGGEVLAGACHAQIPKDLAGRNDERGDQAACAVTDVFVFAFFGLAGLHEDGRMLALEDLHAGLFVGADDQLALLVQDGSLNVELTDVLSLGVEVGIVAVEPIDAAMRLEVGSIQDTPDGRARHGFFGVTVNQDGGEIVQTPLTGHTVMRAGFAGGERNDFELFIGGKSSVADRTAEHLEGQRDRAGESGRAKESLCCGCNRTRWQPADWKADPRLPSAESVHCERPKLAAWSGLGSEPASDFLFRGPGQ